MSLEQVMAWFGYLWCAIGFVLGFFMRPWLWPLEAKESKQ